MSEGYLFWIVRYTSCEGNSRWHMVRTPDTWDAYMVREQAEEYRGGVGDDPAEIESVEEGYETTIYTDYP